MKQTGGRDSNRSSKCLIHMGPFNLQCYITLSQGREVVPSQCLLALLYEEVWRLVPV